MKKQLMLGVSLFALMGIVGIAPAHAQDMGKISIFGGYSYGLNNLGSNNNCFFSDFCDSGSMGMHGYAAAVTYNFAKNIGIEANFSGHNGGGVTYSYTPTANNNGYTEKQTQDIYTYTFGPKITLPVGNFALFTHFLVGGMHADLGDVETCTPATGSDSQTCSSSYYYSAKARGNGMAFKTGAGVDWNHHRWGVRILEVDYVHASASFTGTEGCSGCSTSETAPASANNFELSTGFNVNF